MIEYLRSVNVQYSVRKIGEKLHITRIGMIVACVLFPLLRWVAGNPLKLPGVEDGNNNLSIIRQRSDSNQYLYDWSERMLLLAADSANAWLLSRWVKK